MGALVLHAREGVLAKTRPAGALGAISAPVPPRLGQARADAARLVAEALVGQCASSVARRAQVARQHVSEWADPQSERLPNVGHLLAEGGPFARGVLGGALASLDGDAARAIERADLEREAVVLIARMGAVLAVVGAIRADVPPAVAAQVARDLGQLVLAAERVQRALCRLAREGR